MTKTAALPVTPAEPPRDRFTAAQHMNEIGLVVIGCLLFTVFGATAQGFLSLNNQMTILRDAATVGICAWAMTFVIIAGEIDVSVGPMVAFISVAFAWLLQQAVPLPLAILLAMVFGMLLGGISGVLRAFFDVPSFVATLGLWSVLRGLGLFLTDALPVQFKTSDFMDRLGGDVAGVPTAAVVMFVLFFVFGFVARKTTFGRSVFAVGGNAIAAGLCGINVKAIQVKLFCIAGLMAAITGILLAARLGSGNASAAAGLEFDVIAAVVIGGTALSGGRGSMLGTLLGVFVITIIGNGLVLLGINPFFQDVVRGVIIVAAVLANVMTRKKSEKRS